MPSPMLTANLYVEKNFFGYCTIISNQRQMGFMHSHNYFEAFLVLSGSATHRVNGECTVIEKGSLVLMRPDDEHCYEDPISADYRFINFILRRELMQSVIEFLGPGFAPVADEGAPMPPARTLSSVDFDRLRKTLEELMLYPRTDIEKYNAAFKFAAIETLGCFFKYQDRRDDLGIPAWLRQLMLRMHREEHYVRGLPAMYELSQYSPEHLCRVFRKYFHMSPTAALANIRLEEAAKRLIYTDEAIIDIASSVGFDNLSYFYRRFKAWYGVSPRRYRELSRSAPEQG